jgi:hypothetical protein
MAIGNRPAEAICAQKFKKNAGCLLEEKLADYVNVKYKTLT